MRFTTLCSCLVLLSAPAIAKPEPAQDGGEITRDVPGRALPMERLLPEFPFESPAQIQRHGQRRFVLDEKTHRILIFGPDGTKEGQIGEIGSGEGEFYEPTDFEIVDEQIYVLDSGNRRIQVLDLEGDFVSELPELPAAKGFAVNSKGEILLGQPQKGGLISVYDAEGNVLRTFGEPKTMADLWGPDREESSGEYGLAASRVHIDVDDEDAVYVSYLIGPLLEKYSPEGRLLFSKRMTGPGIDRLETIFWDRPSGTRVLSTPLDGVAVDLVTKSIAVGKADGRRAILVLLGDDSVYWAGDDGSRVARLEPEREDAKGWLWRITTGEQNRFFLLASVFTSEIYRFDLGRPTDP